MVELVDYVPDELPETVLYSPNLDKSDSPIRARGTDFKTKNQLLGNQDNIKKELENKLLSQSLESIELNHDHRQWSDFIHFSSAEKRLQNYNYKVTLIENVQVQVLLRLLLKQMKQNNLKLRLEKYKMDLTTLKNICTFSQVHFSLHQ